MLFMKGDPAAPKCGFSRQTVELLNSLNAEFGSFDILTDEEVRQGTVVVLQLVSREPSAAAAAAAAPNLNTLFPCLSII